MPIFLETVSWMTYNAVLALIPLLFWWLATQSKSKLFKILFGLGWLIFLPNTIYLFTDIIHLRDDFFRVNIMFQLVLVIMHLLLLSIGILSFIYALYPFEKFLRKKKNYREMVFPILFIFNFLISFGVVLGRVERINSWDLFSNPSWVIASTARVFESYQMLIFVIAFGLFCNIIYFGLKKVLMKRD